MNDVITVEETEMQIREYNGQRVVTFRDIDQVHKRPSGTARRNFNKNRKYFEEEKDYFILTRNSNVRKTYNGFSNVNLADIEKIPPKGVTLLTERGYLKVVKSFNDDLSWKVQDILVDTYFQLRNMQDKHYFPKDRDWFRNNEDKINFICSCQGFSTKTFMHIVLRLIGKTYYFDDARAQYLRETGKECATNSEVITYFDNIREEADLILQLAYEKSLESVELTDMKQNSRTLKCKQ